VNAVGTVITNSYSSRKDTGRQAGGVPRCRTPGKKKGDSSGLCGKLGRVYLREKGVHAPG